MSLPNRRSYIVFGIVSAGFLLSSITSTVVSVALPTMLDDLDTSLAWVGWTLTGFQLAQSIISPVSGKLSDDWGARRVLLGSMALFTVSSILAGGAPNVYILILARMLQALGGGAMVPAGASIVSDLFGERRAAAIGLFTTIYPLGGVLGPNIGGFVIDHFSWRWLFYANGPVGVAIFLLGALLIPKGRRLGRRSQIDAVGIGLFAGGVVAILSAMTALGNDAKAVQNPFTWATVVFGVVALVVFVWHEGRTPAPIIELQLLRRRPFFAANLYNFLYGATVFGFTAFIPYYATVAYSMSASESGVILTPRSAIMAITSTAASVFLIRRGYRLPLILGIVLNSVSLLLLSQGYHDWSLLGLQVPNLLLLSFIVLLSGCGHGISGPPSSNVGLDLMPEKVAAMIGVRGMFRQVGAVIGSAGLIMALSHMEDKAAGMQSIYLALGLSILLILPVVYMIPDTARQRYLIDREERRQRMTSATD